MTTRELSFQIANSTTTLRGDPQVIDGLYHYLNGFPAPADKKGYTIELRGRPKQDTQLPPVVTPIVTTSASTIGLQYPGIYSFELDRKTACGYLDYVHYENSSYPAPPRTPWLALKAFYSFLVLQEGGLFLHASAVKFDTGAALFAGESGAGKSTIAAMFPKESIINDDIVVIRPIDNRLMVFSTPFTSTQSILRRHDAQPVACGFSLIQSKIFNHKPLTQADANRLLMKCAIVPDNQELEISAFERCLELSEKIPWRELEFPLVPETVCSGIHETIKKTSAKISLPN